MQIEVSNPKIESSWLELVGDEFKKAYFSELKSFLVAEKKKFAVFPPGAEIFEAFNRCPVQNTKVVILGQDPYHGTGQAHGLCFSVKKGIKPPPSVVNIFKELKADLGVPISSHAELSNWANQGVLLLNTTLTVRQGEAASHQGKGWETFTDAVISKLAAYKQNLVFMLWGKPSQKKEALIEKQNGHLILKAAHPSPLSAYNGFFGCKHFSQCNAFLTAHSLSAINWNLEE